jgi:hypothetical protein
MDLYQREVLERGSKCCRTTVIHPSELWAARVSRFCRGMKSWFR